MKKRILSLITALITAVGLAVIPEVVPESAITASAATDGEYEYEIVKGKAPDASSATADEGDTIKITKYVDASSYVVIPRTIKIDDKDVKVTGIGDGAFKGNKLIKRVYMYDNVKSIGKEAFADCIGLTDLTIGNGVETVGDSAFSGCIGLTSAEIGRNVVSIGESAFSGCRWLTSVILPDSVAVIGDKAFYDCAWLESVKLGDGVADVGKEAFAGCGMSVVNFPASVSNISASAFAWCTELDIIQFNSKRPPVLQDGAFDNCPISTVFVPVGSTAIYSKVDIAGSSYQIFDSKNTANKTTVKKTLGDLNGDGKVTAADVLIALKASTATPATTPATTPNASKSGTLYRQTMEAEKQLMLADVNGDGQITSADALAVLKIYAAR